jgi:hypothetical protein
VAAVGGLLQAHLSPSGPVPVASVESQLSFSFVCDVTDASRGEGFSLPPRLRGVKEQAAAQVQFLTAAETKLAAAIVAALLSGQR